MFQQKSNKKIGRFIGKSDPLRDVVVISDFTLKDIAQEMPLMPDNLAGSIFHHALHNASDEEMGVLASGMVLKDFNPEGGRAILEPMDFTEDWKRQRQRMSSRRRGVEDEEEFELYTDVLAGVPSTGGFTASSPAVEEPAAVVEAQETPEEKRESFFKIQRESVDQAGKNLQSALGGEEPVKEPAQAPIVAQVSAPPSPPPVEERAFVPLRVSLDSEGASPEMDAVRSYQTQLIDREKIIEEAKSIGYQEGFKIGEEKAALQARRQIQELAGTLAPLVAELDGLKKNILVNAQENFQTLCQALMEAVMRREFDMNPGAFASIVERAIQETVPDDSFRIFVHPELLESASRHFSERIRSRLASDKNLPKGDFRVESQLTVVDGNVTQMIRDLLDQADLSLYQTKGKAS